MRSKIKLSEDVQPLTAFRNNSAKWTAKLKRTKRPLALTVNGKTELVVISAAEYDRQQEVLAQISEEEELRLALEDVRAGRVRPVEEFFAEMRKQYGIPD